MTSFECIKGTVCGGVGGLVKGVDLKLLAGHGNPRIRCTEVNCYWSVDSVATHVNCCGSHYDG